MRAVATMPSYRPATSSSASAPPASPPERWRASTAPASTPSSSPAAPFRSVLVVNLGQPGPDAWFDRLPCLAYDEVVTTAVSGAVRRSP